MRVITLSPTLRLLLQPEIWLTVGILGLTHTLEQLITTSYLLRMQLLPESSLWKNIRATTFSGHITKTRRKLKQQLPVKKANQQNQRRKYRFLQRRMATMATTVITVQEQAEQVHNLRPKSWTSSLQA